MFELVKLRNHPYNMDETSRFECDWGNASIYRHTDGYLVSSYALTKTADDGCDSILQLFPTLEEAQQAAETAFAV